MSFPYFTQKICLLRTKYFGIRNDTRCGMEEWKDSCPVKCWAAKSSVTCIAVG